MTGQFKVKINGCEFPVACDNGEEERIKTLAAYVDEKARDLFKKMGGRINDLHNMALVSLILADELIEALEQKEKLLQNATLNITSEDMTIDDPKFVKTLALLAHRMEVIAGTLEGSSSEHQAQAS